MTTNQFPSLLISYVAIATGIIGTLALIFIGLMFSIGAPFGTLNDIFNGLLAIMSSVLAWMLYSYFQKLAVPVSPVLLILALIGTLLAIVGSVLVIFGFTGWFLAGLYTTAGFALIGVWLLVMSSGAWRSNSLPHSLIIFGIISGVIMAIGFTAIPGMIRGIDTQEYFPFTINSLWQLAFLGIYILYPIWCIWLGRILSLK
ncbi:MAG: hypothetical protein A2030_10310 [Chloroflexi bacterium RBG_19FT_COMBO_50_10]|nr:MAG: hypothetical protein A2030_10310 [Chloroflexi bacterium RBG_19FT_COMBO_50_10]